VAGGWLAASPYQPYGSSWRYRLKYQPGAGAITLSLQLAAGEAGRLPSSPSLAAWRKTAAWRQQPPSWRFGRMAMKTEISILMAIMAYQRRNVVAKSI
jgi:hypothetical protein